MFHIDESERMADAEGWVQGLVNELKATGEVTKPVYVSFMGLDEPTDDSFEGN